MLQDHASDIEHLAGDFLGIAALLDAVAYGFRRRTSDGQSTDHELIAVKRDRRVPVCVVVSLSRRGRGPTGQWCEPSGPPFSF